MSNKLHFFTFSLAIIFCFIILGTIFSGCAGERKSLEQALESIQAEELSRHVQILSSDEFEGRAPSSPGEEKTVNYLKEEFEKIGLKPGNGESFFQEVEMVGIEADPTARLEIRTKKVVLPFTFGTDFMAWTLRVVEETYLKDSDMVFVGYGIVAPEYNWNDYEGINVKGKTVVMLVNDPGFASQDPNLFKGKEMTYYGRWTYKFEEAARQGAEGAFIIHETEPAAYPWEVVKNSWSGEKFNLETEDNNMSRCAVEGWLHLEAAKIILEASKLNYEEIKALATKPGFRAIPLASSATITLKNSIRHSKSKNVIAVYPGKHRPDEYIIYMAHWDHFGKDPSLEGDQIYNGALDNATGTAALIELAEAFTRIKPRPSRSIAFLSVTGEEQGLLGSSYFAMNPTFPRTKIVAVLNMDALNIFGKTKDIVVIGYGLSELDDYIDRAAKEVGRYVRPDQRPERGSYYRSDHFSFAREGVPALYISSGTDNIEHGEKWAVEQWEKYLMEKYHKPSDEFDPAWDLSGAIDDLRLIFKVGYILSNETSFPNWREGAEFKAKRDAEMGVKEK